MASAQAAPAALQFGLLDMARAMPTGLAVLDTGGRYDLPPHIDLLNRELLAVAEAIHNPATAEEPRLIITLPPRHGKSTLTSGYFPAWYLGTWPTERVILTSYEAGYAKTWGRFARDALDRNGHLWGVTTHEDVQAANDWLTSHGGGMLTAGPGGSVTGRGGNLVLIDDPIKNDEEARSPTILENRWEWLRSTLLTRIEPGGGAIMILTRWAQGDPAGRLLELQADPNYEGETWRVLNLPAIAEADDPLGRAPGAPLWPERWSLKRLMRRRAVMGPYWWSALYQGTPVPDKGAIFRRSDFRYYRREGDEYVLEHPGGGERRWKIEDCSVVSFFDPAATESELSAYCAITTWAVTGENDLLLLDMTREKAETTRHRALIDSVRAAWSPSVIGIEKGAYGFHSIQSLGAKGYPIKPVRAEKDKVARARVAEARYVQGKIYHPKGAAWLATFEGELLYFPRGRYKDLVDTTSMAGAWVSYGVDEAAEDGGDDLSDILSGAF